MAEQSVSDIVVRPDADRLTSPAYRVFYDGQCEICQACVAWLKTLDHENKTLPLAVGAEVLSTVDSRLRLYECLRQLHVVTPEGEILVGWDAVASLARLFLSTWLIGALGQWFPFRNIGRLLYGFVAINRYLLSKCRGGACRVAKPETVRRQAGLGAFWSCYTLGFLIRLPLVLWAGIKAGIQRLSIFARTSVHRPGLNLPILVPSPRLWMNASTATISPASRVHRSWALAPRHHGLDRYTILLPARDCAPPGIMPRMLAALDLAKRAWSMLARVFPRCSMISQAIAFNLFLAFFPTLLIAVGLATSPVGDKTSLLALITDLTRFLPPDSQQIVSQFLTNRGPDAWKVILVGWSGMLLAGTQVMRLLMEGIHLIYGNRDRFGYLHRQLRAFLLLLLTLAPWLVASILGVFGRPLRHWLARELGNRGPMQSTWAVLFSLAAFSLGFLSLTLIYRFARPGSEKWGNLFPGALVATTLWWLADVLFGLYVRRVPYGIVYGGLAAVIGLMIWMELSVLVIFIGAAWNAELVVSEDFRL